MLFPLGCERSMINLHLSFWWLLGITPNLLIWILVRSDLWKGPATLPSATSSSRYLYTTVSCWITPSRFFLDDLRLGRKWLLKPIWKPSLKPCRKMRVSGWLGWCVRHRLQASSITGVFTLCADTGMCGVDGVSSKLLYHLSNHVLYGVIVIWDEASPISHSTGTSSVVCVWIISKVND